MNIPNDIILTWKDDTIPNYVINKWGNLNENYNILFFNDNDIISFLKTNYDDSYAEFFSKIPFGRYKADFFRLCYLYKKGGCYVDIDIEPLLPIDDILNKKENITFLSVLAYNSGHIFQAVLFSAPNNPIIKMCIDSMLFYGSNIGIDPEDKPPFTGHPTKCMYDNIYKILDSDIKYGYNTYNNECILLGKEIISEGRFATIFPEKKIFGYSRYANYDREGGFT